MSEKDNFAYYFNYVMNWINNTPILRRIGYFVMVIAIFLVFFLFFNNKIRKLINKIKNVRINKEEFFKLERDFFGFLILVSFRFVYHNVILIKILDSIAIIFLLHFIYLISMIIINTIRKRIEQKETTLNTIELTHFVIWKNIMFVFLVTIALFYVFGIWNIDIKPLLASLGVLSIILGFALKDSLANIFSGIAMISDKTFNIGDTVELESGEKGVVYDIGLRSTKIKTYDHRILIIPNQELSKMKIINYAKPDSLYKLRINFDVAYGSDINKVKEIALNVINKYDVVLTKPEPKVVMYDMGEYSLKFKLILWLEDYKKRWITKVNIVEDLYNELIKNSIEIPFKTINIIEKQEKNDHKKYKNLENQEDILKNKSNE